jgi:Isochorismatase family
MMPILGRRALLQSAIMAAASMWAAGGALSGQPARSSTASTTRDRARLDPSDVQILFADLQVTLVAGSKTNSPEAISRSAGVLAQVASILSLPVLFSVVPEGNGPPILIPELRAYAKPGNTLLRRLTGPFMDVPTTSALAANGQKILVIAGFATEVVVLQATLDAIQAGYAVYYVADATGSQSERTEQAAFREMERAGAIATSVLGLTTRLEPDFFHSPGSETFAALLPLLHPLN